MSSTTTTLPASSLAEAVERSQEPLALVGDQGGLSLITGSIAPSGLVPGTISVETEPGTVYLGVEVETQVAPMR